MEIYDFKTIDEPTTYVSRREYESFKDSIMADLARLSKSLQVLVDMIQALKKLE